MSSVIALSDQTKQLTNNPFLYGVAKGLLKLTPPGLVVGAGVASYSLTTALMEKGALDTAIDIAKGIADLPANLKAALNNNDPTVRGEALVDALSIATVGTVVTAKLGQLGYKTLTKAELPASTTGTMAAIDGEMVTNAGTGSALSVPPLRIEYINKVDALKQTVQMLEAQGATTEQIARTVHQLRRDLGVEYKNLTPPDKLEEIYARNITIYGDKLGPTIDWLRAQGKSWESIIESATRAGGKDLKF